MPQPFSALTIRAAIVAGAAAASLITAIPATAPDAVPTTSAAIAAPSPTGPGVATPQVAIPVAFIPAPAAPPTTAVAPVTTELRPVVQAAPPAAPAVVPVVAATDTFAMTRALSKVGSPYRWGATGPNAFDCSGLVTWAYRSTGVSLPRTSRAMSQVGTPVSRADLRPGDLVFFYRPVSHVGIYIGNGRIVHASSRRYPVKISDMARMTFNSARRV